MACGEDYPTNRKWLIACRNPGESVSESYILPFFQWAITPVIPLRVVISSLAKLLSQSGLGSKMTVTWGCQPIQQTTRDCAWKWWSTLINHQILRCLPLNFQGPAPFLNSRQALPSLSLWGQGRNDLPEGSNNDGCKCFEIVNRCIHILYIYTFELTIRHY